MSATVTLTNTTLTASVDSSTRTVSVASASGLIPGTRLWIDRELMAVDRVGVTTSAKTDVFVFRGVDGTAAVPHNSGLTVIIGKAQDFYESDPVGLPPLAPLVQPYINVRNGSTWLAQGDELPNQKRWWQQVEIDYAIGALGIRTETENPT